MPASEKVARLGMLADHTAGSCHDQCSEAHETDLADTLAAGGGDVHGPPPRGAKVDRALRRLSAAANAANPPSGRGVIKKAARRARLEVPARISKMPRPRCPRSARTRPGGNPRPPAG